MAASASGHSGVLRLGYKDVAVLGPWQLQLAPRVPRRYVVSAAVLDRAAYWSTQRPLTLVLRVGEVDWEWSGLDPVFGADEVRAELTGMPTVVRWAKRGG